MEDRMRRSRYNALIGFGSYEIIDRPVTRAIMGVGGDGLPTIPATCEPCPTGQYGCAPFCAAPPVWGGGTPSPAPVPETGGKCPAGEVGIPPACVAIPSNLPIPGPTPVTPAPAPTPTPEAPKPSWWSTLTDAEKWVGVGLVALGGVALLALLRGVSHKPSYAANLRARGRRVKRVPVVRGKRWGRASAPAKYRRLGAKHASDYAYPSRYMYPVVFRRSDGTVNATRSRRHVASGKGYFTKHKRHYPVGVRRQIARNLNRAARRFGLRPDVRA
jgi:hypothetical protein